MLLKGIEIKVGTRGSALALTQTGIVVKRLESALAESGIQRSVSVHDIKTLGDKKQGTQQAAFGDKKDWIYELELALLAGEIDLAVHSGKDVPSNIESGTLLIPVLERELANDVFIGKLQPDGARVRFADLGGSGLIGTASLRRKAALKMAFPSLRLVDHRGNITTRVEKLDRSSDLSGIILAAAGLLRLDLFEQLSAEILPIDLLMPAVSQGVLVVQIRSDDDELANYLQPLIHEPTRLAWQSERIVIERLEGDCRSSISVYCGSIDRDLELRARVMLPDGSRCLEASGRLPATLENSVKLGELVSENLIEKGACELIEASRSIS